MSRPACRQPVGQRPTGPDPGTAHPERHTIVAEGVDLEVVDRAVATVRASAEPMPEAVADLRRRVEQLAPARRALPFIVFVGRLHRVKGMATLVEAWARGPLRDRANLLIVGGDLGRPSRDEREQLDRIDAVGGGAQSDVYLAVLADVWGVPVRRRTIVEEANSLGAAVTGAVGLGLTDFSAARALSEVTAEFTPDPSRHAVYAERHARFTDSYTALAPWFAGRPR